MYFLNGDRIYIKPIKVCGTFGEELQNCLLQLKNINSGKKIFKLNFFIDTISKEDYIHFQQTIHHEVYGLFSDEILLSVLAQPPLVGKLIIEACYYDPLFWKSDFVSKGENGAVLFEREDCRILIGNVQSNKSEDCRINSEKAFGHFSEIFETVGFQINSIIRQWNYIENILGFDGSKQRYQEFNNVRSDFYGDSFKEKGYPAATGIGMNLGGTIIEFIAIQSDRLVTVPIDNPEQVAAHSYSKKVLVGEECMLKTTPKFERARFLELFGKKIIFISGTASIRGEQTVGIGDPALQTEVTIENIKQLYSDKVLSKVSNGDLVPKYGHARIYIKDRKDFAAIRKTFRMHFGNLPVVYIVADICRPDLLVEIEGKVILE
jgi:enamine deaminase RidA (YjgF/YER057c/UK114 family)